MAKTYRAVVIGAGKIGASWGMEPGRPQPASYAAAFRADSRTELVGISDTHPESLKTAADFYRVPVYDDSGECLDSLKPDIVAIATPPESHERLLSLAIDSGAAVICEKPVSGSLESARAMLERARSAGALVVVNHQRRFFPIFKNLRERIRNGEFGRVQEGNAYYSNGILNNGSHSVDALQYLLSDRVAWVVGKENRLNRTAPFGANIDGLLGFEKGTVVSIQGLDDASWGVHDFVLLGTDAAAVIHQYGFRLDVVPVREGVSFPGMRELDWDRADAHVDRRSMLAGTVEHVIACLDGAAPESTLEDGYRTMQVLDALVRSASEDGKTTYITYS